MNYSNDVEGIEQLKVLSISRYLILITVACIFLLGTVCLINAGGLNAGGKRDRSQQLKTVQDRLNEFGEVVDQRMKPLFTAQHISYPPAYLTFIGLKAERVLQLYAANRDKKFRLIKEYPFKAASGVLGPKLQEGDLQVPEGLYRISFLNANSRFHLSLRVNYPNEFDHKMAVLDKRTNLGGDIMIHGNAVSIGCIAIGDPNAEDFFILAARTGIQNISVILSPVDFRVRNLPDNMPPLPKWIDKLYPKIETELQKYPR